MDFDINNISVVLGVLGAYFAILLVMSVSVETILEPFSFFKGLQKQVNPDDVVREVQEWLPEGSGEAAKVVAIETFAAKSRIQMDELNSIANEQALKVEATLKDLGLGDQVDIEKKKIAIKLSSLRERYAASKRQRITTLRTLSAIIGIGIAFALQINTFDILGSFFTAEVMQSLDSQLGQIGGVILTGLAASAGSSFWHDMLGRARNVKDTVKQVEYLKVQEKETEQAVG
jgi:hypothetical protein